MLEMIFGIVGAALVIFLMSSWIKISERRALAKISKPVPAAATQEPANTSCRPNHELVALEKNAGITPSDNEAEHENTCRLYSTELIDGEWKVITRNQQALPTLGLAKSEPASDRNICPATGAMRETHFWRPQGANMLQCSYCGKTKNAFDPISPQREPSVSRSNTKTTCSNAPSGLTNHVWRLEDNNILRCINCGVSQNEFSSYMATILKQIRSNVSVPPPHRGGISNQSDFETLHEAAKRMVNNFTVPSAADYQRKQMEVLLDIKRKADTAITEGQLYCEHTSHAEILDELHNLDGSSFTMWRCTRCKFEWTIVKLAEQNKP